MCSSCVYFNARKWSRPFCGSGWNGGRKGRSEWGIGVAIYAISYGSDKKN